MNRKLGWTGGLAQGAAQRPWHVLGIWLLVLIGSFFLAGNLNFNGEGGVESTDARRASALIQEATGEELRAEEFVLVEASDGPLNEQVFASTVSAIVDDMRALSVVTYLMGGERVARDVVRYPELGMQLTSAGFEKITP